jgi:hypothetical protein
MGISGKIVTKIMIKFLILNKSNKELQNMFIQQILSILRNEEHGYFIDLLKTDIHDFMYGENREAMDPAQKIKIISNFQFYEEYLRYMIKEHEDPSK